MNKLAALSFIVALMGLNQAHAVTIVDKDDWKVKMDGFVENDVTYDTTRSFTEVEGSAPVAAAGTFNGDNNRLTYSARNSRLGFSVMAPTQNDWKTKAVLEFDFLGLPSGTTASEAATYSNALLRTRHAYLDMEKNGWYFLAGQTWSLFGFQPNYIPATVSVAPLQGYLFQRTLQVTAMDKMAMGDNGLTLAASLARPSQRDSATPNVDVGARFVMGGRKSGLASTVSNVTAEGMSLAFSATMRSFEYADKATSVSHAITNSTAWSANILLPILAGDGNDMSHTLTLLGGYFTGTGLADELPNWSGGLAGFPTGTNKTGANTNLDAGYAGLDTNGAFSLVNIEGYNAQLQYHFSKESGMFMTLGYGMTFSNNAVTPLGSTYNRMGGMYANLFKDITSQIRVAAEYSQDVTTYSTGLTPANERYQGSAYFRF